MPEDSLDKLNEKLRKVRDKLFEHSLMYRRVEHAYLDLTEEILRMDESAHLLSSMLDNKIEELRRRV